MGQPVQSSTSVCRTGQKEKGTKAGGPGKRGEAHWLGPVGRVEAVHLRGHLQHSRCPSLDQLPMQSLSSDACCERRFGGIKGATATSHFVPRFTPSLSQALPTTNATKIMRILSSSSHHAASPLYPASSSASPCCLGQSLGGCGLSVAAPSAHGHILHFFAFFCMSVLGKRGIHCPFQKRGHGM